MRQVAKVASIVGLALFITACNKNDAQQEAPKEQPPVEVGVLEIITVEQNISVELPGRSRANLIAEVRPQVSGIITERSFVEGSEVKAGDSLYQIDSATYNAELVSAQADLTRANAKLSSAKAKATRYQALIKNNSISKQDFDDATSAYKEALADVTVAEASINTGKISLDYTKVKAPISGRIGTSSVTAGALVTANQIESLATIQQLDPINVDIVQSSAQLLRLKATLKQGKLQATENASVSLVLEDGTTYSEQGTLQFSELSVDENTGSVTLRAEFPNPDGLLLPGMYVRAMVNTGTDPAAILVPQKAITRNPKGEAVVMVVGAENKVEPRVVVTAEVIGNQWRVIDGLQAGDQLIVEGLQKIRPGAVINPQPLTASSDQE